ncbi:MAG: hypothetical protein HY513_04335 [Candidatus Aenigmarchaeota archaeon]|nr:hypothetical protein [Candidatus Aenigmarchaeota archaeon]
MLRGKITVIVFLLFSFYAISSVHAEPSIIDYKLIIDGNSTNATAVYISPQSTPGTADGVHFSITANESVNWTLTILDSNNETKMGPLTDKNSLTLEKPNGCYYWNGTSSGCTGSNLSDGTYTVNVTFSINYTVNNSGNITSMFLEVQNLSRKIIIDNSPSVSIISPSGFTHNNTITLNYIVDSSVNLCVREWINQSGMSYNKTMPNCTGETWTVNDSTHKIIMWVNNVFNKSAFAVTTFTVDASPPGISITSPINTTYNTSSVDLNYSVSEPANACTRDLDGSNATISNCTNITISSLLPGDHFINLWANDSAGNLNVSSVAFKINYAEIYPSVSIQDPDNQTYLESTIFLNYTVSASNQTSLQCFYSLNHGPNNTLTNCTNTTLTLADGSYLLHVFANNSYFINGSKISFAIDTTAPPLAVNSPVNTTYSSISVLLNFITSGDAICSYELNGVISSLPGCFNATINAANGLNKITIFAKDDSGNTRSKSVNFTVTTSASTSTGTGTGAQGSQNQNNQNQQKNTTANQTKPPDTVNRIMNTTNVSNTEASVNSSTNKTTNSTSSATGLAFAIPISLETAALIAAIIVVIIAAAILLKKFRPNFKRKHDNIVNNSSPES